MQENTPVNGEASAVRMRDCCECDKEYVREDANGMSVGYSSDFCSVECSAMHHTHQRECNNCGSDYDDRHTEYSGYCSEFCYEEATAHDGDEDEMPERLYSPKDLPAFQSKESGSIITSQRVFSAEVECYYDEMENMQTAARALPDEMGISGDGSLGDNGVEFQTPKLRGKKGEETIQHLCDTLRAEDFRVDNSCGLHIHLDGKGLLPSRRTKDRPKSLIALWSFYVAFEPVLLSFLPPKRRTNSFCRRMANEVSLVQLAGLRTLDEAEHVWYKSRTRNDLKYRKSQKYDDSRYFGVNLHSLFKDGHMEVRYHSGTLNARKILEWTNLHQIILDSAANTDTYALCAAVDSAQEHLELAEKTQEFWNALQPHISESSRAYFMARQAKFGSRGATVKNVAEESDLETPEVATLTLVA